MAPTDDAGREADDAGPGPRRDACRYRVSADQSVSEAVVAAVASTAGHRVAGVPAAGEDAALEPLYDAIDPDALDALFRRPDDGGAPPGTVEFTYAGYEVTVEGRDVVRVAAR